MLPLLVLIGDIISIFGAYMVSINLLGFNPATYIKNSWDILEVIDIVTGLVKAGIFGFIVALTGCFYGFRSRGGAQGVGAATTGAVVTGSILILSSNLLITQLFFSN